MMVFYNRYRQQTKTMHIHHFGVLNYNGLKGMYLNSLFKVNGNILERIRRYGLDGESISLEVDLEVSSI